ncbi:uncharacterized protein LOC111197390 [Astyanax mexicanus]|uniref:uncharacterized protein LOC111197390 n=1 Tax=Astyanax mexicanus TaxID=7994 RepID=UPI0020CAA7EA|nr:uncharacterized protein LOC111197390 [Astyanax mexicanus]
MISMSAKKKKWEKERRSKREIAGIVGKNVLYIIDYHDRPGKASAEGPYAEAGAYACASEGKPGKRVPKAGVFAEAGVGRARAEWRVCEAEAKGPNASAGVHADILGVEAEAAASLGQAQAQFGILEAEVKGPNASAGAYASVFGVEAKAAAVLGQAQAQFGILEAEVKGPNASAGAQAGIEGVGAMARAEIASASASAGPVEVKAGVGFDTGVSINPLKFSAECKVLGCGLSLGGKMSVSLLGSELSINLW